MDLKKYIEEKQDQIKLDFLTIRLHKEKINSQVWGLVDNSNEYYFDNWYLKLVLDTHNNKYSFYNLYDKNLNLIWQLCITTPLNTDSKLYNKLVLYWTFFNFFYEDFYKDIFDFFWVTLESKITRFDLKIDIPWLPISKIPFKNQKITKFVEKSWLITWRSKEVLQRYKFRVYDKKLDILDNNFQTKMSVWGNFPYNEVLLENKNTPLTRLELQINSKYIKTNKWTLWNVFNKQILYKVFNNLLSENLVWYGKKIRFSKEDLNEADNISVISYNQKLKITNARAHSYLKKLFLLDHKNFKRNLYKILYDIAPSYAFEVSDDIYTNNIKPLWFKP